MAAKLLARRLLCVGRRWQSTFAQNLEAQEKHAMKSTSMWKFISLFVALPASALVAWNAYRLETEHWSHPRADFIPYTYLRIRKKPFPWGDGNHTLLHNPSVNPLPTGYEDE